MRGITTAVVAAFVLAVLAAIPAFLTDVLLFPALALVFAFVGALLTIARSLHAHTYRS